MAPARSLPQVTEAGHRFRSRHSFYRSWFSSPALSLDRSTVANSRCTVTYQVTDISSCNRVEQAGVVRRLPD
jgi:hypothetical protein